MTFCAVFLHSFDSASEVVVQNGAVSFRRGVPSAARSHRLVVHLWEQSQDHKGERRSRLSQGKSKQEIASVQDLISRDA